MRASLHWSHYAFHVRLSYNPATGRDGRAGGGVEMPMERQYRGWVLTLATFMGGWARSGRRLPNRPGTRLSKGRSVASSRQARAISSPILCQTSINPGLPVLDLSLVWHADPKSGERVLDSIRIRRSGEAGSFQVLTGIASHLPADTGKAGVEMLDLNFDGFLDMQIRRSADGAEGSYQKLALVEGERRLRRQSRPRCDRRPEIRCRRSGDRPAVGARHGRTGRGHCSMTAQRRFSCIARPTRPVRTASAGATSTTASMTS